MAFISCFICNTRAFVMCALKNYLLTYEFSRECFEFGCQQQCVWTYYKVYVSSATLKSAHSLVICLLLIILHLQLLVMSVHSLLIAS